MGFGRWLGISSKGKDLSEDERTTEERIQVALDKLVTGAKAFGNRTMSAEDAEEALRRQGILPEGWRLRASDSTSSGYRPTQAASTKKAVMHAGILAGAGMTGFGLAGLGPMAGLAAAGGGGGAAAGGAGAGIGETGAVTGLAGSGFGAGGGLAGGAGAALGGAVLPSSTIAPLAGGLPAVAPSGLMAGAGGAAGAGGGALGLSPQMWQLIASSGAGAFNNMAAGNRSEAETAAAMERARMATAADENARDPFRQSMAQMKNLGRLDMMENFRPQGPAAPVGKYASAVATPQAPSYLPSADLIKWAAMMKRNVASGQNVAPTMTNPNNYGQTSALDLNTMGSQGLDPATQMGATRPPMPAGAPTSLTDFLLAATNRRASDRTQR